MASLLFLLWQSNGIFAADGKESLQVIEVNTKETKLTQPMIIDLSKTEKKSFFSKIKISNPIQIFHFNKVELKEIKFNYRPYFFGFAFFLGAYNLLIFFLFEKTKKYLWIFFISALILINFLDISAKSNFLTYYLLAPIFIFYLKYIYKEQIRGLLFFAFQAIAIFLLIAVLALPDFIRQFIEPLYARISIAIYFYIAYRLIMNIYSEAEGAVNNFSRYLFILFFAIIDFVFKRYGVGIELLCVGFMLFFITEIIFILKSNKQIITQSAEKLDLSKKERIFLNNELLMKANLLERGKSDNLKFSHEYQQLLEQEKDKCEKQISLIKESKRQYKFLNQRKNVFLHNISESILINLKKAENLNNLKQSIFQLKQIRNSIINLNQLEDPDDEIEQKQICLEELLEDLKDAIKPLLFGKDVQLKIKSFYESTKIIETDKNKLELILENLINNAVKFTDNGEISLTISAIDKKLIFTISDTGCGIPEKNLNHVFQPFIKTENKENIGLGLGLTLAKKYVEILGGQINLESQINKGTIVTFFINLKEINIEKKIIKVEPEKILEKSKIIVENKLFRVKKNKGKISPNIEVLT